MAAKEKYYCKKSWTKYLKSLFVIDKEWFCKRQFSFSFTLGQKKQKLGYVKFLTDEEKL